MQSAIKNLKWFVKWCIKVTGSVTAISSDAYFIKLNAI